MTKPKDESPSEKPDAGEDVKISFKELGFIPEILKALNDLGYEHPTPIQAQAIPAAMQGRDVLGIAQTGTGKTGAFTLPILQRMAKGRARARMPRCLIVCPTRELAAQVAENVEEYGKYLKISMALLIGGVSFAKQEIKLNRGVDVLIATPGRLLDHFERGKVLLTGVQALVVDEADRMLDMGFIPDIERIFKLTPFTRQVLFYSATMPDEIKRLVEQFLHQPHHVQIARKNMTAKTVTQFIVKMPSNDSKQKRTALRYAIDNLDVKNGIVFCNRKRDVDIVAKSLTVHGHNAAPIHGDLAQSVRMQTLEDFKIGKIQFLIASDVAARGLDVPNVSHVFNYDVPSHSEDYVHRIGRTGRAGRKGETIMFVAPSDSQYYVEILKLIAVKQIKEYEIEGIADFQTGSARRGNGQGRGKTRGHKGRGRDRKPRHSSENTAPKQDKSTNQKSKPKRTTSKQSPPQLPKDQEKSQNKPQNESQRKSQNKPQGKTQKRTQDKTQNNAKGKYGRNALPANDKSGFGNAIPAFFGANLKK